MADRILSPILGRPVISRDEAIALGLKRFYTGLPCSNGHVEERLVKGWKCLGCHRDRMAKSRAEDPERHAAIAADFLRRNPNYGKRKYRKNAESYKRRAEDWRAQNLKRVAANMRAWRQRNPERWKAICRAAYKRSVRERIGRNRLRELAKAQRTPAWADKKAILEFYKNRPAGHHVDHIYPLNGETVCGLHVLENLQYLPAAENIRKLNRMPSADPS